MEREEKRLQQFRQLRPRNHCTVPSFADLRN
jgi:hypothetical protein